MNNLLAPLEKFDDFESADITPENITKIPIPDVSYLIKQNSNVGRSESKPLTKYAKEFDKFCEWSALPKDLRKPKTAMEWERRNLMPKGYTNYFKSREDYMNKRLTYFWNWMMDLYPDVVYAVYQRASHAKGSDKAAGIFIDLLSKKMNLDKPQVQIQPMVLLGVPQERIDALFVPKGYQEAIDATNQSK